MDILFKRILNHRLFEKWEAKDIYRVIRSQADKINTVISAGEDSVLLNSGVESQVESFLSKPDLGIPLPWAILNKMFRGCRLGKVIFNGFLSNEGKSRNMMLLIAYIVLAMDEKFLLLSNEMDEDDLRNCLVVTVINNKCFKELHGIDIEKPEEEIVLGIYRDNNGNVVERKTNENGDFIETEEEYKHRVATTSDEFQKVNASCKMGYQKRQGKLYFKDVGF